MINRHLLLAAIGTAYARATNQNKRVDDQLANAIADEVLSVLEICEKAAPKAFVAFAGPDGDPGPVNQCAPMEAPAGAEPTSKYSLRERLAKVLNECSVEAGAGNTPDYILAKFLHDMLFTFGDAVRLREQHYRRDPDQGPPTADARMRLTLSPTSSKTDLYGPVNRGDSVEARVWEGVDENGTKVTAFIALVAVDTAEPPEAHARFAKALKEKPMAGAVNAWPLRMFCD